jgi:hypothetical protein
LDYTGNHGELEGGCDISAILRGLNSLSVGKMRFQEELSSGTNLLGDYEFS